MTTKATITLKGLEKYLAAIAAAGRDIDQAADEALLAGAKVVQEAMQELAPVDTGNLKDHIKIKGPIQDGNHHSIDVGLIHDKAYTDAETARYGMAQEYGWGDKKGYRAGRSFIVAGRDKSKNKARAAMRKSLKDAGKI